MRVFKTLLLSAATVTLADEELFAVFGSGTVEATEAVLVMTVPSVADALTPTIISIVSDAPDSIGLKTAVTVLPF